MSLFSQRDPLDSVSCPTPWPIGTSFQLNVSWVSGYLCYPQPCWVSLYFLSLSVGMLPATIHKFLGTLDSEPFVCITVIFEEQKHVLHPLSSPFCSSSHFLPGVFNGLLLPLRLSKPSVLPAQALREAFPPSRLLPHVPFGAPQASSTPTTDRMHACFSPLSLPNRTGLTGERDIIHGFPCCLQACPQ